MGASLLSRHYHLCSVGNCHSTPNCSLSGRKMIWILKQYVVLMYGLSGESFLFFYFFFPPRCLFFLCICSQESHCAASTFVSIVCVSVLCKISYTREVKSTVMQVVNKYGFADAICLVNKEFCYCNIHSCAYFLCLVEFSHLIKQMSLKF